MTQSPFRALPFALFTSFTLLAAPSGCSSSDDPTSTSAGASSGGNAGSSSGGKSGGGGTAAANGGSGGSGGNIVINGGNGGVTGHAGNPNASSGSGGMAMGGTSNAGGMGGTASNAGSGGGGAGGLANGGSAGTVASGGSGGGALVSGTIVPLYTDPSDSSWGAIIKAKQAHTSVNVVAIVNPNSGPGDSVDSSYTSGIAKLVTAGIVPIGYVSTDYTKRGIPYVETNIDSWHTFYPKLQGIFFDEQSITPGDEGFYSTVSAYAKGKGLSFTVGNPGTGVPDSFLGSVDVMLAYESGGVPKLSSLTKYAAHRTAFGIIPYAAAFDAAYVKSAAQSVAYVYLTNDDLPNPWDSLPSYFDSLLGALAAP